MGKSKGRAPKKPKPGKGGGSGSGTKDSVTGITIDFDGIGRVTSDQVFNRDSALGSAVLSSDAAYKASLTSWEAEVELSNQFIVLTTSAKGNPPNSMSQENSRVVLQGDFHFMGSKMQSARVDYIAQVSDGITSEYGTLESFRSGVTISNPASISSWQSSLAAPGEILASYDFYGGSGSGDKSTIASFGGGRFFYDGWQNNPFAANLV
jgi:hypothetical protein